MFYRLPRIRSLAFVTDHDRGALVLEPTRLGMTDESHMRMPSGPRTLSWGSTTANGSEPILQVPVGW